MTLFSLRANFFLYISKPFPYLTLHSFPVIFYPSFSLYMSFPLSLVGESLPYSCFLFCSSFPHFIIMVFFKSSFPFPPLPTFSYLTDHSLIFPPLSSSSLRLYTLPFFLPLLFTSCPFPPYSLYFTLIPPSSSPSSNPPSCTFNSLNLHQFTLATSLIDPPF